MQITFDLLSLIVGLIFGCGLMGLIIMIVYFDDKWDTAFGAGWKCGNEYQEMKQKKKDGEQNDN